MITKDNYAEMMLRRQETMNSPDFVTKAEMWRSIRGHCVECVGTSHEVSRCEGDDWVGRCPLHPYRFGCRDVESDAPTSKPSLRKAVKSMCIQCMSGNIKCESESCNLRHIRWQA
jgi:hypothetical protein